ncbi:c-type cytochrome [Agaribacter flavus]|uniref:C-type cytochrome n=1 Tax=Agaribacter flavus TaxID=1902781 RepID=A0ABV7FL29_9ALTE
MFKKLWMLCLCSPLFAIAGSDFEDLLPVPESLVTCMVCHGSQLMGSEGTRAPRLLGLQPWYLRNQIDAFKKGWRGVHEDDVTGYEMLPVAQSITPEMLEEAINFIARATAPLPDKTIDGDPISGEKLYTQCAACHGASGEGNEALGAPRLTGLNDWYISTQLNYFKSGVRGGDPENTNGVIMASAAQSLSDDKMIADVTAYISSLQQLTIGK